MADKLVEHCRKRSGWQSGTKSSKSAIPYRCCILNSQISCTTGTALSLLYSIDTTLTCLLSRLSSIQSLLRPNRDHDCCLHGLRTYLGNRTIHHSDRASNQSVNQSIPNLRARTLFWTQPQTDLLSTHFFALTKSQLRHLNNTTHTVSDSGLLSS